uniref:Uncharacterized protein n=1 Tax=Lotus japonicus TaxID=34305 RepID=I3T398_LOTJA|nr:unknown [Lotus japonicus]
MAKKKASIPFLSLTSIVFLPWCISFTCKKGMEYWVTNWWNTKQSEIFLNIIQEKSILKKFMELEELFFLDELLKEYSETRLQILRTGIHKETIQFDQDAQRRSYLYNFALLDKYNLFHYSKWLFYSR